MTHDEASTLDRPNRRGIDPDSGTSTASLDREIRDHLILAEAFQMQDVELRQTFELRREASTITAERVVAQLPSTARPEPNVPKVPKRKWLSFVPPLAAAASLAAVLLIWMKPSDPIPTGPPRSCSGNGPS